MEPGQPGQPGHPAAFAIDSLTDGLVFTYSKLKILYVRSSSIWTKMALYLVKIFFRQVSSSMVLRHVQMENDVIVALK